jgi:hypothetical protein
MDLGAAQAADRVYASVDVLAAAMRAQLAALAGAAEFRLWVRANPTFKPRLSGFLSTAQGVRQVTILLDTGATHCFICARLAAALGLPLSGQPRVAECRRVGPARAALGRDRGRRGAAGAGGAGAGAAQPGLRAPRVDVQWTWTWA